MLSELFCTGKAASRSDHNVMTSILGYLRDDGNLPPFSFSLLERGIATAAFGMGVCQIRVAELEPVHATPADTQPPISLARGLRLTVREDMVAVVGKLVTHTHTHTHMNKHSPFEDGTGKSEALHVQSEVT